MQSGANNGNLVLLNDGNGFFSDSLQPIGTDSDQHVAVGDIDGDGDLDLVGTSGSIFLNDGLGQFSQSTESIPYLVTSHVILEDFDSDGDLDVFQVNWSNNPDKVYLNNGFGEFTDSGLSLGAEFSSHAAAGDIDNDGDLDVVIASARPNQPNRVWFNNSLASQNPYDFDHDGDVNGDDIDMLCVAVREGSTNAILDIDGNGLIESPDFSLYLDILGTKLGDANLDGVVDVSDFAIWIANKFTSNEPLLSHVGWSTADFNCDGVTDVSDFSIWNANKFSVALRIAGETNSNEETAQKAELNRTYQIRVKADEVSDTSGNALPNSIIGTFQVSVARDYDGDGNTPWEFEPTQSQEHSTNRDSQTEDSMELALIDRVFETTGN